MRGVASVVMDNDSFNQGELHRPLNTVHDLVLTFRMRGGRAQWIMLVAIDGNKLHGYVREHSGFTC